MFGGSLDVGLLCWSRKTASDNPRWVGCLSERGEDISCRDGENTSSWFSLSEEKREESCPNFSKNLMNGSSTQGTEGGWVKSRMGARWMPSRERFSRRERYQQKNWEHKDQCIPFTVLPSTSLKLFSPEAIFFFIWNNCDNSYVLTNWVCLLRCLLELYKRLNQFPMN